MIPIRVFGFVCNDAGFWSDIDVVIKVTEGQEWEQLQDAFKATHFTYWLISYEKVIE